jgi:preprotein translocase subunit SecD
MAYGEKKMKLSFKIWILIILLSFSIISIFGIPPTFLQKGVLITSVETNSSAYEQGLFKGQIITEIDGEKINNLEDYTRIISQKFSSGELIKTTLKTQESEIILFSETLPEITVSNIPKTNLKLGLDLSGGSRALIRAENKTLSQEEILDLVDITSNRLNEFGIEDVRVVSVSDLDGNNYMLVEIAGATPKDLQNILAQQGKFEAKIGEEIVFVGGVDKDIASVCRGDARCSGIESCVPVSGGFSCRFAFSVFLSEEAAKRHAEITSNLEVNKTPEGSYLSEKLDLYVDDNLLSSLLISEGLKGRIETQIQVSGSGSGATRNDAIDNSEEEMHNLQTILITGSLPYKLEIVKLDTISPVLGKEFITSVLVAGLAAFLAISIVIFFRYKKIKSSLLLLITSASELIIIIGIAAFIDWNIDIPSMAGILASIGTGIDSQIIILDESHEEEGEMSLKKRLKRAFGIILGTYFTTLAALFPLWWAGAGLLKGFAITTMIGISVGVVITRPAFIDMLKLTKS